MANIMDGKPMSTLIEPADKIWAHYLSVAQAHVKEGERVLKTDGFNEHRDRPIDGGIARNLASNRVTLSEIDGDIAKELSESGYDCLRHDIRVDAFDEHVFDVILDCSTIDHVDWEGARKILRNYNKWLVPGGRLVLFAWCSDDEDDLVQCVNGQFYFDKGKFLHEIMQRMHLVSHEDVYLTSLEGPRYLLQVVAENRPWWYLHECEGRIEKLLEILTEEKIRGKTILDLNCGTAPLYARLPRVYEHYYGTDAYAHLPSFEPQATFSNLADDDVYVGSLDILLCLGLPPPRYNQWESPTVHTSIMRMLQVQRPRMVVLESATTLACMAHSEIQHMMSQLGYELQTHHVAGAGYAWRTILVGELR